MPLTYLECTFSVPVTYRTLNVHLAYTLDPILGLYRGHHKGLYVLEEIDQRRLQMQK